jgi:hypothetical protein
LVPLLLRAEFAQLQKLAQVSKRLEHFNEFRMWQKHMLNGHLIMSESIKSIAVQGNTFRHRKRRTTYTVIANATLQTALPISDDTEIVIYQGDDGRIWARPAAEFFDGRFEDSSGPEE